MCPLCREVEEDKHHTQCCLDPGACEERSRFRDILETELAQIHTHPDLTTLLFQSMMLQKQQQLVVDINVHSEEESLWQLLASQGEIGWDNVQLGFWSTKWRHV